MAYNKSSLEDPEFWLPSEFLSDLDFLVDMQDLKKKSFRLSPTEFDSALNYPVDSNACLGETERSTKSIACLAEIERSTVAKSNACLAETEWSSEEDDFLAGLTRRFAQSSFQDVHEYYLLYAAASEAARLKMKQQNTQWSPPVTVPCVPKTSNAVSFNSSSGLSHPNQLGQPTQVQLLKQQLLREAKMGWTSKPQIQEHIENRGRIVGYDSVRFGHPISQSRSVWPLLAEHQRQLPQVSAGSTVRASFAGPTNLKKKCAGTGVFLPRRYDNTSTPQAHKNSGCSSDRLPGKVSQAQLNMGFGNNSGRTRPRLNACNPQDVMMGQSNDFFIHQRQILRAHEVSLPQKWTY